MSTSVDGVLRSLRMWVAVLTCTVCTAFFVCPAQTSAAPTPEEQGHREQQRPPEGGAEDEARAAFREGSEAAQAQRWSEAEKAFGRAYTLSGAPSALFNQAVALRALGRHVAARDAFTRLLAMGDAQLTPEQRVEVTRLRDESAARVAVLELRGLGPGPYELLVDGARWTYDRDRPLRLELDTGAHHVEVRRSGLTPFARKVALEPGQWTAIQVTFAPAEVEVKPRARRALWWAGGVAVVLGAGLVWGLTRDDPQPLSPRADVVVRVP